MVRGKYQKKTRAIEERVKRTKCPVGTFHVPSDAREKGSTTILTSPFTRNLAFHFTAHCIHCRQQIESSTGDTHAVLPPSGKATDVVLVWRTTVFVIQEEPW